MHNKMKLKKQKLINHVALVIDDSASMAWLADKTREVVSQLITNFAKTGKNNNQETRLSIYTFGDHVTPICFDMDPDDVGKYQDYITGGSGMTALIDASCRAINDLQSLPTKIGDHSFLIYIITDGAENKSKQTPSHLSGLLQSLNDDFTIGVMVPNVQGKHAAKNLGFDADNIEIWETTEKGIEEAAQKMDFAYASYASARTMGIKSTKSLFKFDSKLDKKDVRKALDPVDASEYETLIVRPYYNEWPIKDFVESLTKRAYRVGSAYYQLTKKETIQASKAIAVIEKSTGKMYSGPNARDLLGLPNYEVKVEPADFQKFDIFVQSTSTNRKLVGNTHLIVFK